MGQLPMNELDAAEITNNDYSAINPVESDRDINTLEEQRKSVENINDAPPLLLTDMQNPTIELMNRPQQNNQGIYST